MSPKITFEIEDDDDFEVVERIIHELRESGEESASGEESRLSKKHEYVLQTLRENPGYARKVVHKRAAELDGSPFTEPDKDGEERREVGNVLWELSRLDRAHNSGNRWYPS